MSAFAKCSCNRCLNEVMEAIGFGPEAPIGCQTANDCSLSDLSPLQLALTAATNLRRSCRSEKILPRLLFRKTLGLRRAQVGSKSRTGWPPNPDSRPPSRLTRSTADLAQIELAKGCEQTEARQTSCGLNAPSKQMEWVCRLACQKRPGALKAGPCILLSGLGFAEHHDETPVVGVRMIGTVINIGLNKSQWRN